MICAISIPYKTLLFAKNCKYMKRFGSWGQHVICRSRQNNFGTNRCGTVSYTHLDVYKRQALLFVSYRTLLILGLPFKKQRGRQKYDGIKIMKRSQKPLRGIKLKGTLTTTRIQLKLLKISKCLDARAHKVAENFEKIAKILKNIWIAAGLKKKDNKRCV